MLRLVGECRSVRLTYDQGDLELMAPSLNHEEFGNLLGRVIETVTVELQMPCRGLGSTTWRKQLKGRGLEPDECYYLARFPQVRGKKKIDLSVDLAPDLAIEVEISRSALDRMGIYAALGVSEVWRFDGETLLVEHFQADGTYRTVGASPSLPMLPLEEVVRWVHLYETIEDQTEWNRQLQVWVRKTLVPGPG
jgi:Uma2 family endonuclease